VKLDDAKAVLAAFGMPPGQQNPNAVYTLLAFANIGPKTAWSKASNPRRTPHDVIAFARDNYQKNLCREYARDDSSAGDPPICARRPPCT
jgi:hypothetical protein